MKELSLIASAASSLELLNPGTNDPVGLTVQVLPPDDPKIKEQIRAIQDKRRLLASKGRIALTADDERASKALCIAAVTGWEWTKDTNGEYIGSWEGSQPDYSATLWASMLDRVEPFRKQVDEFLGDDKNFFK